MTSGMDSAFLDAAPSVSGAWPAPPRPWAIARHPALEYEDPRTWWAVVSCFFNPAGYRRPVANLGAFLDWCYAERVPVYMAELSFHDARPVLPEEWPHVRHFRAGDEGIMFQKEALLNAVVAGLPAHVRYVFFMDADVVLEEGRVALELAAQDLVDRVALSQPWHRAVWCDAAGRPGPAKLGTAGAWETKLAAGAEVVDPAVYHPGFVYGMARSTWEEMGGLYGCPITGTGDVALWQAALAPLLPAPVMGRSHFSAPSPVGWRARVAQAVHGPAECRAGAVSGTVRHFYHGRMARRRYNQRHHLLEHFRPERDLVTREDGLPVWSKAVNGSLREAVKRYFFSRGEDD